MWQIGRRSYIDRRGCSNPVDSIGVDTYWRAARLYSRSSLGCLLDPRHLGRLAIRPPRRTSSWRAARRSENRALGWTVGRFGARPVDRLGSGHDLELLHADLGTGAS